MNDNPDIAAEEIHLKLTHDWENHWNPREYLSQYYETPRVADDEKTIFEFLTHHLRSLNAPLSGALDIGTGPTLHHEIMLVPYTRQLDVADYLQPNLTEISRWLNNERTAHNWDIYVKGILAMEGALNITPSTVETRKRLVKERVRQVLRCDIKQAQPLGSAKQYPLVTAFYLADSVASSKADWSAYMGNIANLVAPGGLLLMSALRNAEFYRVGNALFPSAKVNEDDVRRFFQASDFQASTIDVQVDFVAEWKDEGFDSIIIAAARKNS